jgi:precorrin-6A/cobalt-precorrin-6A reductase
MKLLLLAGSGEAREIAAALAQMPGVEAIASLAGATRTPAKLALPTISGGFGGDEGFRAWLRDNRIGAVLDATHPFAAHITHRTARICREEGIAYCHFLRPAWQAEAGDNWHMINDESEAAQHIAPASTVFLATGRQTLNRFANLAESTLICRQIDRAKEDFPFPNGRFLVGRPPFSTDDELALFAKLKIDWLIVKNAGGEASKTKLIAARQLGIPVVMIARPAMPDAPRVRSVAEALEWVAAL